MDTECIAFLNQILNEIKELKSIVLSDKTNAQWLDEKQAAAMMPYKAVLRFRRLVKDSVLPIEFCTTNGRSVQYSRKSINKYLSEHSTILKIPTRPMKKS